MCLGGLFTALKTITDFFIMIFFEELKGVSYNIAIMGPCLSRHLENKTFVKILFYVLPKLLENKYFLLD